MNNIADNLSRFFEQHLPLVQQMQLRVESYDGKTLILSAPLAPNVNDKLTAFGGSLYNVAVMSCWGMAFLKTQEHSIVCNQVVTRANIVYNSPVKGTIRAICHAPEDDVVESFIQRFQQRGKARLDLKSTISCGGKTAVEFEGQYAILSG